MLPASLVYLIFLPFWKATNSGLTMEYLKEFSHEVKTNCLYQFKFKFKGFKNFQIHSDNNAIQ